MVCRVGKNIWKTSSQHPISSDDENPRPRSGERFEGVRRLGCHTVRWRWLLGIPAVLTLAAPVHADTAWAILSFDAAPPVAVGSVDLRLDFDPNVLHPVVQPITSTEIAPLVCVGEPPPAPCASSAGPADGLVLGNAATPGQATIAVISAAGLMDAGDVLAVLFDVEPGAEPAANLTVTTISDVMSAPLPPQQQPTIGLRFVVPEPGADSLGVAAIATCLVLQRSTRRRRPGDTSC